MGDGIGNKQRWLIQRLSRPLPIQATGHPVHFTPLAVRVVMFDLYGTLISSAAGDVGTSDGVGSQSAFVAALGDGGWAPQDGQMPKSGEAMLRQAIQESHRQSIDGGNHYPEVDIIRIWQKVLTRIGLSGLDPERVELTAISYECRTNPVWPMPGLQGLLEQLAAGPLQLGILSNAQFYTPILLETLLDNPLALFNRELVIWSYREMLAKPCPTLFATVNQRLADLGIRPGEVVFVGNDMYKDIAPASAAGWHTILFAGDARSLRLREDDPQLQAVQPDMVINDIGQLAQILI